MPDKKIDYQKLEKELKMDKQSCWEVWDEKTAKNAFGFAEEYKTYLNKSKTARDAVKTGVEMLEKAGFQDLSKFKTLKSGDKVFAINREKSIFFAQIGKKGFENGFKMIMSHIDSPHLDFKVNPLYEDENIAYLKTHYYGGIKKYQWPTIALALHGVVFLKNGQKLEIEIGEKDDDPIFMITDLLPHLDRAGGPGSSIKNREVSGEDLNLVVGSMPIGDEKIKEKVKLAILKYLWDKYGISEDDLSSSELEAVPSEKARDLGFDRSMISAYGQDDSACAFLTLKSVLEAKYSYETRLGILIDREEIGSEGNTGAQSVFLEIFISDLLKMSGLSGSIDEIYRIYHKSRALSADTTPAVDPDYKEVYDLKGAPRMGFGMVVEKYVGAGGKYFTSDASAQFIYELKSAFSKNKNILYQISGGGSGKIDLGGAGTIAKYMANRNLDIIDVGIAMFNLHAPLEIASKADLYCAYLGFKAFFEEDLG